MQKAKLEPHVQAFERIMSLTTHRRFRSAWSGEAAEIDIHKELYGMSADEFEFLDETCPVCGSRLDQFGWCGHGNIGGD